jgi:hypothetical protein
MLGPDDIVFAGSNNLEGSCIELRESGNGCSSPDLPDHVLGAIEYRDDTAVALGHRTGDGFRITLDGRMGD